MVCIFDLVEQVTHSDPIIQCVVTAEYEITRVSDSPYSQMDWRLKGTNQLGHLKSTLVDVMIRIKLCPLRVMCL